MEATKFPGKSGDLSVVIYSGDNKILIAMSLEDEAVDEYRRESRGICDLAEI